MFSLRNNTFKSELFNEKTFYKRFLKDLSCSKKEVIIESPYITSSRMETLYPVFQGLLHKNIKIHLITRDPADHEDEYFRHQSTNEILKCKELGINFALAKWSKYDEEAAQMAKFNLSSPKQLKGVIDLLLGR